jgi:hypothetical protein
MKINVPDKLIKKTISSIMENFPEASYGGSLRCIGWNYQKMQFDFVDGETDKKYLVDEPKLLKAFKLTMTDKWPKGCTPIPLSTSASRWDDWLCQSDAIDYDAFVQLAVFGEVIYG